MLWLAAKILLVTMSMGLVVEVLNTAIRKRGKAQPDLLSGETVDRTRHLRAARALAVALAVLAPFLLVYLEFSAIDRSSHTRDCSTPRLERWCN